MRGRGSRRVVARMWEDSSFAAYQKLPNYAPSTTKLIFYVCYFRTTLYYCSEEKGSLGHSCSSRVTQIGGNG